MVYEKKTTNKERLRMLYEITKRKRKVLILIHNNPDPDALAASFALKNLFQVKFNVTSVIVYGGIVGRAENKELIKHLKIDIKRVADVNIRNFSVIALIDTQPGSGNNALPDSIIPSIIIDHHRPIRAKSRKARYVDIRTDYGSTSTILTEYFRDSEIEEIDRKVATALLYGIKTDTRDLGRGTSSKDMKAFLFLYPRVLFKTLSKIEHPHLPREYFKVFERTINNAVLFKDSVISYVGIVNNPDSLAEMADFLVRLDGVKWALSLGRYKDDIYFSLRTTIKKERADLIARRMVGMAGSAGGHNMIAAGKLHSAPIPEDGYEDAVNTLITRFLERIKRNEIQGKKL